jgi:hypothetical protein
VEGDVSLTAGTPLGEIRIYTPVTDDPFDGKRCGVLQGRFVPRGNGVVESQPRIN